MSRRLPAMKTRLRLIIGRMMLFQSSRPEGGTHSSFTANQNMNIMPSQKEGADCPIRATSLPTRFSAVPRLTEERIPSGIPTTMENKKRGYTKLHGGPYTTGDNLYDGLPLTYRLAEVALKHIRHKDGVLLVFGLVQPQFRPQRLPLGFAGLIAQEQGPWGLLRYAPG